MWSLFRSKARQARSVRRTPLSCRPRLEALEDRCLMSAPGSLDTTFGSGGIVTTSFGSKSNDWASAVAVQADGKIVEAGISKTYTSTTLNSFDVVRYNANGTLDSTFGTGGAVQTSFPAGSIAGTVGHAVSLLVQPDGKILLEGRVNNNFELIRYNGNGTLDKTFNSTGMVNTAFPYAAAQVGGLALESVNGVTKIVAANDVNGPNGYSPALARYNLDGSLDATFGGGGEVVSNLGYDAGADALAIQPDGKIVVASTAHNSFFVARYDLSGSLDTAFGNGGVANGAVAGQASTVIVQPDGKIVAGGEGFTSSGGLAGWAMERLNSDGSLDSSFGTGGVVGSPFANPTSQGDRIRALAIQTNGKLVAAGTFTNVGFALARYNADGSLDTTFGTGGKATTAINGGGSLMALALEADGKIVAAGFAAKSKSNSAPELALARYWGDSVPVIGSFTASPSPVATNSGVTLTASNITDANPNSTITQVAFYLDTSNGNEQLDSGDALLGYATQTSPGVWTLTDASAFGLTAGTYRLFAQAQDSAGVLSYAAAFTLTVQ